MPRAPLALALSLALVTLSAGVACQSAPAPAPAPRLLSAPAEDAAALSAFLDGVYEASLARSPTRLGYLGRGDRQGEWTPLSDAFAEAELGHTLRALEEMRRRFDPEALPDSARLSYRLFEHRAEEAAEAYRWRLYRYPINQMHGTHSWLPGYLISIHRIQDEGDARDYIARLRGVAPLFAELEAQMRSSQDAGVLPPAFVFPYALKDCENILKGAPFEPGAEDSTILADFRGKVSALEGLDDAARAALLQEAEAALLERVAPAYRSLMALLRDQAAVASSDDGAWKFPEGDAFYASALSRFTTTDLSADAIHQLGLQEVARIQGEMDAIRASQGFEGDLEAYFAHMKVAPELFYPDTDAGRAAYLKDVDALLAEMQARLPAFFITLPEGGLEVRAVEPYRERSAGKAFYSRGTPDGSRPGRYYANLYDMSAMPRYQMAALAFHEGIPGHHLQNSVAQELGEGIPLFRRQGGYTAYGEGWGLYAESLAKEMGFYEEPTADFGRLTLELWRACRLVVDTGIHDLKWTREEAIAYLLANTPNSKGDVVKAVERYIVMPGQATAYKVGQLKILALREDARSRLGDAFDLRAFHEVVLTQGPMPLDLLAGEVERWIEAGGGGAFTLPQAPPAY